MRSPGRRHIVLIGLPGAGKTVVGRRLAEALHARFTDLDLAIVARAEMPVARIFSEQGEATFRRLEREAMATVLAEPPQVIAVGGGWAAEPGNLGAMGDRALVVYLRVSPETAASRLGTDRSRPLLENEPLGHLHRLLGDREVYYRTPGFEVETEGLVPEQVAQAVAGLARRHAGW
ncbi:MAG TPA: shikimate kinase [Gemmatimonadales bacterium]